MIRNWLSILIREVLSGQQLRRVSRPALRRRGRLRLEVLEDREVPSIASTAPSIQYLAYLPTSTTASSGTSGASSDESVNYFAFSIESHGGSLAGLERILEDLQNLAGVSPSAPTSLPTSPPPPPIGLSESTSLPTSPPALETTTGEMAASPPQATNTLGEDSTAAAYDAEVLAESGFTVLSTQVVTLPSSYPVSVLDVNSGTTFAAGGPTNVYITAFAAESTIDVEVSEVGRAVTAELTNLLEGNATGGSVTVYETIPVGGNAVSGGEGSAPLVTLTPTSGSTPSDDVSPLGLVRIDDVSTSTPELRFFTSTTAVVSPTTAAGEAGPVAIAASPIEWMARSAPNTFQPLMLTPGGVFPFSNTDQLEPGTSTATPTGGDAPSNSDLSLPDSASDTVSGSVLLTQTPLVITTPQGRKISGAWSESTSIPLAFGGGTSTAYQVPQSRRADGVTHSAQDPSSGPPTWQSGAGPRAASIATLDRTETNYEIQPTLADLPDGTLLRRFVTRGEQAAFTELVMRHERSVLAIGMKVLGDMHSAQDVFQATILVLARRASLLDGRTPLGGWLAKVAYHLALRYRFAAQRQRHLERDAATGKSLQTPNEFTTDLEKDELRRALREELQHLPEKYRVPLVRCYFDGRTHAEVAQEIGLPRGSIAKRIGEGLERLRDRLLTRGFML